uniref:Uncharacterized protein n=1 Tax=Setaria italica TaxID=4555 RepID=K3ZYZ8_SETIT
MSYERILTGVRATGRGMGDYQISSATTIMALLCHLIQPNPQAARFSEHKRTSRY